MKKFALHFVCLLFIGFSACDTQNETNKDLTDPLNARVHTLENGLKVYLSVNKEKPRIQTVIAVNTGSSNDPKEVTGLAHYLEHMLFKGTSKLGTINWEEESKLLDAISDAYETLRAESDEAKRKAIYAKIDSLSSEAAKHAVPNEYDKLSTGIGSQGTNAYTSNERTVYISDIPATELEKWMKIEAERFSELTLRLFHTELETVYEEFNRAQDSDYRKSYKAMNEMLYKVHPYGTQTTLGLGDHLKNPSMVKIHEYFNTYYVPNNVAICLAGDFDPAEAIALIEKNFGGWERKDVTQPIHPKEDPIAEVQESTVYGPQEEWVQIGYRLDGYHSEDALMLPMLSSVLSNGTAGIIDLELIQAQKVLEAYAYGYSMRDYSLFMMGGSSKSDQSLEEVRDLLLEQLERVKNGDFPDELIPSVIRNNKVEQLQQLEYNYLRTDLMSDAFIMGVEWDEYLARMDSSNHITKQRLADWTKSRFNNNHSVVYKKTGEDTATHKVEKPQITAIDINRDVQSDFYTQIDSMESLRLTPEFVNFERDLAVKELQEGVKFYHVANTTNDLFRLFFELDEDLRNDPKVRFALEYLSFLGTDSLSSEEIKEELYSLGVRFNTRASDWKVYASLSGLEESFDDGLTLLEHLMRNAVADQEALDNMVADKMKEREDDKKSKWRIMSGLKALAKGGSENSFNNKLSAEELEALTADELVAIIGTIMDHPHRVFYYGKSSVDDVFAKVKEQHKLPETLLRVENPIEFEEVETDKPIVYFADYDMVQTEMTMLSKGEKFNPDKSSLRSLFNQYFGSGLSSVVFQEIRESKALAYSAYAYFSTPSKPDKSHYLQVYLGTQNDKLGDAIVAMDSLLTRIPEGTEQQFEQSQISSLKSLESNRVIKQSIYWVFRSYEDKGLPNDYLKTLYEEIGKLSMEEMEQFFNEQVAGKEFVYCVIGKKDEMDMAELTKLGEVKEVTLEEIFGY